MFLDKFCACCKIRLETKKVSKVARTFFCEQDCLFVNCKECYSTYVLAAKPLDKKKKVVASVMLKHKKDCFEVFSSRKAKRLKCTDTLSIEEKQKSRDLEALLVDANQEPVDFQEIDEMSVLSKEPKSHFIKHL